MKRRWLGWLAGLAAAFFLGVGTGSLKFRGDAEPPKGERTVRERCAVSQPMEAQATTRAEARVALGPRDARRELRAILELEDPMTRSVELATWAGTVDPELIPEALSWIAEIEPPGLRRGPMLALIERWALSDRSAALEAATEIRSPQLRADTMYRVVSEWSRDDPDRALLWLESQPSGGMKHDLISMVARDLAAHDPDKALKAIERLPRLTAAQQRNGIVSVWAENDPEAASAYAMSLPSEFERTQLVGSVAMTRASQNPEETFDWLQTLPAGTVEPHVYGYVVSQVANDSPGDAIALLDRIESRAAKRAAQERFVASWAITEPNKAFAWAKELPEGAGRQESLRQVLNQATALEPSTAAALIDEIEPSRTRVDAVGQIAGGWANRNAEQALAWADKLEDPNERDTAFAAMAYPLAQQDASRASELIGELSGNSRTMMVSAVASEMGMHRPQEAIAWAQDLEGSDQERAMVDIARSWGLIAPKDAASHLDRLASGSAKNEAVAELAVTWAGSDPSSALAWLSNQGGELESRSTDAVLRTWVYRQPDAAWDWIESVSDADSRRRYYETTYDALRASDEGAARRLIDRSDLEDAFREELIQRGEPPDCACAP
ncbi:MAG: hypothetical protein AAFQ65_02240 [Myxococcota bacterium]